MNKIRKKIWYVIGLVLLVLGTLIMGLEYFFVVFGILCLIKGWLTEEEPTNHT